VSVTICENPPQPQISLSRLNLLAATEALGSKCPELPSIRAGAIWPDTQYCVRPGTSPLVSGSI
jgi:hypothetical protein